MARPAADRRRDPRRASRGRRRPAFRWAPTVRLLETSPPAAGTCPADGLRAWGPPAAPRPDPGGTAVGPRRATGPFGRATAMAGRGARAAATHGRWGTPARGPPLLPITHISA